MGLPFCGSGSSGLPGCRLLLSGCMSQLALAPAAAASSAQPEGCLDWASWLVDGVMHGFCWDSDGFFVEVLMDSA